MSLNCLDWSLYKAPDITVLFYGFSVSPAYEMMSHCKYFPLNRFSPLSLLDAWLLFCLFKTCNEHHSSQNILPALPATTWQDSNKFNKALEPCIMQHYIYVHSFASMTSDFSVHVHFSTILSPCIFSRASFHSVYVCNSVKLRKKQGAFLAPNPFL